MCVCVCVCKREREITSFVQCFFLVLFCNLYTQRTMQKVIISAVPISPSWIRNARGRRRGGNHMTGCLIR